MSDELPLDEAPAPLSGNKAHIRGAIEAGVVEKDYLVDAPIADLADIAGSASREAGRRRRP